MTMLMAVTAIDTRLYRLLALLNPYNLELTMDQLIKAWGNKKEAAILLNCSPRTLKSYRDRGEILEYIHWRRVSQTKIEYNLLLLEDFMKNRENTERHLKICKKYYS